MSRALICRDLSKRFANSEIGMLTRAMAWLHGRKLETTTVVDGVKRYPVEGLDEMYFDVLGPPTPTYPPVSSMPMVAFIEFHLFTEEYTSSIRFEPS